jgi:hypothetical protein
VYVFYDQSGAIGKVFACIDLLRARTHTARRECRSFTPFVSRHHMQIVCISMTPQAARDNGNERRSRYVDVHSRHRYRSQRGGA